MIKQISDNEIHLLIKYIKSVLWRVVKCLSYTDDAWCLKVNLHKIRNRTLIHHNCAISTKINVTVHIMDS